MYSEMWFKKGDLEFMIFIHLTVHTYSYRHISPIFKKTTHWVVFVPLPIGNTDKNSLYGNHLRDLLKMAKEKNAPRVGRKTTQSRTIKLLCT